MSTDDNDEDLVALVGLRRNWPVGGGSKNAKPEEWLVDDMAGVDKFDATSGKKPSGAMTGE